MKSLTLKAASTLFPILLTVASSQAVFAQTAAPPPRPSYPIETFYLNNVSQGIEAAEIQTAIRNMLTPEARVYFIPSQNAITISASPDQVLVARKILTDLDRPRRTYRLTYTLTESDNGKRVGVQHVAMVVVSGQHTNLKQGSKIPIATGSLSSGPGSQTQFTYIDVGLNFDATLDESANGVRLRSKVEQSSIADEKSSIGVADPVVRQTVLEGTSILTPGKSIVLGSMDILASTRHEEVEVLMEVVR